MCQQLKPDTIKWSELEGTMLHALRQHDLGDRETFIRLSRNTLPAWLTKIDAADLHLVVTTCEYSILTGRTLLFLIGVAVYPFITILHMDTPELYRQPSVHSSFAVPQLLPGRVTYTIYKVSLHQRAHTPRSHAFDFKCPEGTACPTTDAVADLVKSLRIETMEEVSTTARLYEVNPWGYARDDLHFVTVSYL